MFCLYTLFSAQAKIQMLKTSCRIFTILLKSFLKSLELYPFDVRITKICKKLKFHNSFSWHYIHASKMGQPIQLIFSILVCPHKAIVGFRFLLYFRNPWIKWVWKMLLIVGKNSGIPWLYKPIINARQFTNEDFMMSETLGLVKTLGWKVVDGIILTIQVPI